MRLAIVVSPTYEGDERLRPISASASAERMALRLARPDAGFRVESTSADRLLATRLSGLIAATENLQSLLVYFAGHVSVGEQGEVVLHLDDQAVLGLDLFRAKLVDVSADVLLILDLTHDVIEDDFAPSASVVDAVRELLAVRQTRLSALVAARSADHAEASLFTSLFLTMLDRLAQRPPPITVDAVYSAMRGEADEFYRIPAAAQLQGERAFSLLVEPPLVEANRTAQAGSVARPSAGPRLSFAAGAEEQVREGDMEAASGRYDQALAAYKRALSMLGAKNTAAHRAIHVKVGIAQRGRGSDAQALASFDKALAIDPSYEPALEASAEVLRGQKDWPRLERLLTRQLEALDSSADRRPLLRSIADFWLDDAGDVRKAAEALERALGEHPDDVYLLTRLVQVETKLGRHDAAINTRRRLADALGDDQAARRARVLNEAALAAAEHSPNEADAVAFAEQAVSADPSSPDALELAARLLGKLKRWADLIRVYESVMARVEDAELCWDLSRKVGAIYRDELADPASARLHFERALEYKPSDVEARCELAALFQAGAEYERAAELMRDAAGLGEVRADVYRRALSVFEKSGEPDAAWNAASVLEMLDQADINEQVYVDAHRPDGLLAVQGGLTDQDWQEQLLSPERDVELDSVLRAAAAPAIRVELARLKRKRLLTEPDPEARQDLEKSTTMLARSLTWTSRVLGVPAPRLFVLSEVDGDLALLPGAEPTAIASRSLGSGLGLAELAFLWGRHLSYYRPEHYLLVHFGTLQALGGVLLAALSLGDDAGQAPSSLDGAALALLEKLRAELSDQERGALSAAVASFQPTNTRRRLRGWARSVHLACGRAGLLACGDIKAATELVRRFPPHGELAVEDQIRDLCSFSISPEYARLREKLGVKVPDAQRER